MLETALLDVRVLPWRPRGRVMEPDTLRENTDAGLAGDDLAGVVLSLALWLVVIMAAPLIVLVLAAGLLTVELPIVLALRSRGIAPCGEQSVASGPSTTAAA